MNKLIATICLVFVLVPATIALAKTQEWRRIDDRQAFDKIYLDKTLRGVSLPTSEKDIQRLDTDWRIEYCSDGTGILIFWEQETPRTWNISDDNEVCISTMYGEKCYFCEESLKYQDIYRCGVVGSKEAPWAFKVENEKPVSCP